jgi:protein-S-isoprenylcysteine O-methyltransferase Ste14
VSKTIAFTWRGIGVVSANLGLAVLFLAFAYAHLRQFFETPRYSLLMAVAVELLVAVLVVARRDPDRTYHSPATWVATSCGTLVPLLLRPTDAPTDLLLGQAVQFLGLCLQIGAMLSLNRSFGLLPAHRGVKSDGLYRWVRHPLYSAYLLAQLGYLVNNLTAYNVVIVVAATVFQIIRVRQEERLLTEYADYRAYVEQTRWRLYPGVW